MIKRKKHNYKVGDKLYFLGEKHPYQIKSLDNRYLVCTKPFNLKHTVMYTIVDLDRDVRGTESLIFCMGFETDSQCEDALSRLQKKESEVSYRNYAPIHIDRVVHEGQESPAKVEKKIKKNKLPNRKTTFRKAADKKNPTKK